MKEKKRRLRKKKNLEEKWEMIRWCSDYINQNNEEWESFGDAAETTAIDWEKMRRMEKIKLLKRKSEKKPKERSSISAESSCDKSVVGQGKDDIENESLKISRLRPMTPISAGKSYKDEEELPDEIIQESDKKKGKLKTGTVLKKIYPKNKKKEDMPYTSSHS